MPDPRFFERAKPSFTLAEIAELSGSKLADGVDGAQSVDNVAPLDVAEGSDLSFLDNIKYKEQFTVTKAGACFVQPAMAEFAPDGVSLLITPTPYKSYALAAQAFYPQNAFDAAISEQASIHPDATIGAGCRIDPMAVIGANAEIGENCWIESGAVVADNVQIGARCRIGSNSNVSHAVIGDHVHLYPGVRIGQDGFGFAIDPSGYVKVPQLGRVVIGSHVEIGSNTCIDRGAGPDTVIGQGTWIDNLVQIGHNVKIGNGCVIVSQVGISGSTVIEDYVVIGGQVGIAGHLRVGTGVRIAAQSGVMRDVPAGQEVMGSPAIPIKENMRQIVAVKRLIKK